MYIKNRIIKRAFRASNVVKTFPAPVGGLNAWDPLAAMPPTDAISLINWIPDSFGVRARKGYKEWAINIPGALSVESIFPYFSSATAFAGGAFLTDPTTMPGKLFASTKDGIYDITDTTDAPALSQALSGASYAGWFSTAILTNIAGSYLLACSESDGYFQYNGTAWTKITTEVTGVAAEDLVHVLLFKKRAWFVERDSTRAWYLAADAIQGAATVFDFGAQFKHGGHLSYLANWTIDAGEGIDDYLVAVSSNGDVVLYKGSDPASASTFGMVGSWFIGQIPVGRRAYTQYGGDLILLSAEGVFPLSFVTRGGATSLQASGKEYSSKIRSLIGADLRASFTERGWQMVVHPSERLLIVNTPDYGANRNSQYAMSTSLNEWCQFRNVPSYCMGSTAGYTFAGTSDGRVLLLFSSKYDAVPWGASTGTKISGIAHPAFSDFGAPVSQKQFVMVRPSFVSEEAPSVLMSMSVDFNPVDPTGTPTFSSTPEGATWGSGIWGVSTWGGALKSYAEWSSVGAIGFSGALSMATICLGDTTMTSISYMLKPGGPL